MSDAKMRHCFFCGAELGIIERRYYDRRDTCGKQECEREARNDWQAEREEAHYQLDHDNGWSSW